MKSAAHWLQQYSLTHQNPVNKKIHAFCVPLIYWSVFALLWAMRPELALVVLVPVLGFYLSLGWRYFFAMAVMSGGILASVYLMAAYEWPLNWIGAGIFIGAWAGQFYGHKLEGKKPAFLDDLLFLLIGPLWVLARFRGAINIAGTPDGR